MKAKGNIYELMTCPKCGKKFKKSSNYCPYCGNRNPSKGTNRDSDSTQTEVSRSGSYGYDRDSNGTVNTTAELDLRKIPIGNVIDDRYQVEEKLGSGGFGTVYKVWDQDAECFKALKVIHYEFYDDKEVISDLKNETKMLMKVFSNNVVRVWDIHLHGDIKYIDMEYLDGQDLVEFKLSYPDKKVPEPLVIKIALQLAKGMKDIHDNNIIHKDLKPQNIMLTKDGKIKIMDFGIAESFQSFQSRIVESKRSGTYPYMAPEQLEGRNLGKEADIWSFGIILYELLTGKRIYTGNSYADVLAQIDRRGFKPLGNVSPFMNKLLANCLIKDYKGRIGKFDRVIKYLLGKKKLKANFQTDTMEQNIHSDQDTKINEYNKRKIKRLHKSDFNALVKNIESEILDKTYNEEKYKSPVDRILIGIAALVVLIIIIYFGIDLYKESQRTISRNIIKEEIKRFHIEIMAFYNQPVRNGGCGRQISNDEKYNLCSYLGWRDCVWETTNANYTLNIINETDVIVTGEGFVTGNNKISNIQVRMIVHFKDKPEYVIKILN